MCACACVRVCVGQGRRSFVPEFNRAVDNELRRETKALLQPVLCFVYFLAGDLDR